MKSKNKDNPDILYYTPEPVDNTRLSNLCGALDENLRQISARWISKSPVVAAISSSAAKTPPLACKSSWISMPAADKPVSINDIQLALVEQRAINNNLAAGVPAAVLVESEMTNPVLKTRRNDLRGRTPRQVDYLKAILEHDITFGIGPWPVPAKPTSP